MSNPTISKGHTWVNGAKVTPILLNKMVDEATLNFTQSNVLAGRSTSGAGEAEEIPCTAAGRSLLAAADLAALRVLVGGAQLGRVTTQFDKTTDTTLENVPGLSVDVEAGKTYSFEVVMNATVNVTGRDKVAIAGTCTATSFFSHFVKSPTGWQIFPTNFGSSVDIGDGVNATAQCWIKGTISVANAGTLAVQFAQNSASGTSSVLVGSHLRVWGY